MSENEMEIVPVTGGEVESFEEEHGSPDLLTFARDLAITYNFCRSLVKTPFVPAQYQNNPGNAAAAIMAARGVGITDPMAALRALDVIQGTPAFRANTLRALVQRAGHEIWVEESTSQRAIVKGRRAGSDIVQQSVWDMDRAKQLKLTGKDNWVKQPTAMLVARATAECARLVASDAVMGLYAVEELSDGVQPDESPVVDAPKRRMRRKPVKKEDPKPEETPEEPAEEPSEPVESSEPVDEGEVFELQEPPLEDRDDGFPAKPEGWE